MAKKRRFWTENLHNYRIMKTIKFSVNQSFTCFSSATLSHSPVSVQLHSVIHLFQFSHSPVSVQPHSVGSASSSSSSTVSVSLPPRPDPEHDETRLL